MARHSHAVTRHRRASHPAAASVATALAATDSGAPGNRTCSLRVVTACNILRKQNSRKGIVLFTYWFDTVFDNGDTLLKLF
jgi:hypothetical protein